MVVPSEIRASVPVPVKAPAAAVATPIVRSALVPAASDAAPLVVIEAEADDQSASSASVNATSVPLLAIATVPTSIAPTCWLASVIAVLPITGSA